jgi:hypothetical protein
MKTSFSVLVAAVTAVAFAIVADAQPAAGAPEKASGAYPMDCA